MKLVLEGIMLKDKVAVVTGGSRGIGYATVKKFLENGATVVLLASKEESVNQAVSKLKEINKDYEVYGFYPNLMKEEEVDRKSTRLNSSHE